MDGDSNRTLAERVYRQLYDQIANHMPRRDGVHIYSTDNMFNHLKGEETPTGWRIIVSKDVPYSHYAMGYDDNGNRRTARIPKDPTQPHLEEMNFEVVPNAIDRVREILKDAGLEEII